MATPAQTASLDPQTQSFPAPSLKRLQNLVADDLKKVDALILERVRCNVPLIEQVAQYIIASGGKRLRPSLTIACAKLCGYEGNRHIALAATGELIHTVSLLHDDVVDDSKLRRGNATANNVWGNKASVLAGDFLLSRSIQLMVEDGSPEVMFIFAATSGILAQGEVMQLIATNNPETTLEQYIEIIKAKTAALISAVTEMGAVITERKDWRHPLKEFGLNLGIAYQLVDDALDYVAEEETLGKAVGNDFREGKITLPVILAYQQADKDEKAFWHRTVKDQHIEESDLQEAIRLIARHGGIEGTLALARDYGDKALENLSGFPASAAKTALLETVDFCLQRAY